MKCLRLLSTVIFLLTAFQNCCLSQEHGNALLTYIKNDDSSYTWENLKVSPGAGGTYYEVGLVSQKWQNITWSHRLIFYVPSKADSPDNLLLVLRHIYDREAGVASLKIISDSTNTSSAILYDVPNQPLFDGREEDDLQAYTFSQYIQSGDESWPLLFPMVKSVVRAMDAIQDITKRESKVQVNRFIIAGHSKRGHTTWLTAAIDKRVAGIIPMAIDILNSTAQLPHQLEAFGEYSTPSKAATDFLKELELPRGKNLIRMVDAYTYRDQLTLPKLIVSPSADNFFTTDALNLYWDGLKGPKWILYLSNADHVSAYSDPRINSTAFAFVRAVALHKQLPDIRWKYTRTKEGVMLTITAGQSSTNASVWLCHSESKDFRRSLWTEKQMEHASSKTGNREFVTAIQKPVKGFSAVFGQVEFMQGNSRFLLTTQTHIIPEKEKP